MKWIKETGIWAAMVAACITLAVIFGGRGVVKQVQAATDRMVEVQIVRVHKHDPAHWFTDPFSNTTLERTDNHYRFELQGTGLGNPGDKFTMKERQIP